MTWGFVPWVVGAVIVGLHLRRLVRQADERERDRQARHEAEMSRLKAEWDREEAEERAEWEREQAELDRLEADDGPPPDPLAAIEAELDYLRELVADLRKERERQPAPAAAPALASPLAAAMVMVPSERP